MIIPQSKILIVSMAGHSIEPPVSPLPLQVRKRYFWLQCETDGMFLNLIMINSGLLPVWMSEVGETIEPWLSVSEESSEDFVRSSTGGTAGAAVVKGILYSSNASNAYAVYSTNIFILTPLFLKASTCIRMHCYSARICFGFRAALMNKKTTAARHPWGRVSDTWGLRSWGPMAGPLISNLIIAIGLFEYCMTFRLLSVQMFRNHL